MDKNKLKQYLSMAKRANVRIKALNDNGLSEYNTSKMYLESRGRTKFFEGTKFENDAVFERAFKEVGYFLEGQTTVKQAKNLAKKEGKEIKENKYSTDYKKMKKMTRQEKEELSRKLSMIANGRIRTLRKNGINQYAMANADLYFQNTGTKQFYTGRNHKSEKDLNIQLMEVTSFLNAKSSTIGGLKAIREQRKETFERKFEEAGINFKFTKEKEKSFFDFLSSKQFDALSKFADSDDIIEDFATALLDKYSQEEIMNQYQLYLDNEEMTFDQVEKMRKSMRQFR